MLPSRQHLYPPGRSNAVCDVVGVDMAAVVHIFLLRIAQFIDLGIDVLRDSYERSPSFLSSLLAGTFDPDKTHTLEGFFFLPMP
jgi:hypothetical protein